MVTVAVPATLSPLVVTLCIAATSYACPTPWQTTQLSFDTIPGPGGPVEPPSPAAPVAPVAPTAPESPDPHPRKRNGTISKIEQIKTSTLFDMKPTLLFP